MFLHLSATTNPEFVYHKAFFIPNMEQNTLKDCIRFQSKMMATASFKNNSGISCFFEQ